MINLLGGGKLKRDFTEKVIFDVHVGKRKSIVYLGSYGTPIVLPVLYHLISALS